MTFRGCGPGHVHNPGPGLGTRNTGNPDACLEGDLDLENHVPSDFDAAALGTCQPFSGLVVHICSHIGSRVNPAVLRRVLTAGEEEGSNDAGPWPKRCRARGALKLDCC